MFDSIFLVENWFQTKQQYNENYYHSSVHIRNGVHDRIASKLYYLYSIIQMNPLCADDESVRFFPIATAVLLLVSDQLIFRFTIYISFASKIQ